MINMDVTVLGASSTGKSCYLYAMADNMIIGHNGFTFNASSYEKGMVLEDRWNTFCDSGIWPDGTTESSEWEFDVNYSLKTIAQFSWYDYRGGILAHKDLDDADVKEFFDRLNSSSCLLIFVQATDLKSLLVRDQNTAAAGQRLKKYSQLLIRYAKETECKKLPIAIVVTKGDLITADEYKQGVDLLKRYFNSIFLSMDDGDGWHVAITRCGLGDPDSPLQGETGNKVIGIVNPFNIHIPILFAVRSGLIGSLAKYSNSLNSRTYDYTRHARSLEYEENKGFWESIFTSDDSDYYREQKKIAEADVERLKKKIESFKKDIVNITKEISLSKETYIYDNGELLELDS